MWLSALGPPHGQPLHDNYLRGVDPASGTGNAIRQALTVVFDDARKKVIGVAIDQDSRLAIFACGADGSACTGNRTTFQVSLGSSITNAFLETSRRRVVVDEPGGRVLALSARGASGHVQLVRCPFSLGAGCAVVDVNPAAASLAAPAAFVDALRVLTTSRRAFPRALPSAQ